MTEPSDDTDALIRSAYAVVANPERLFALQGMLERASLRADGTVENMEQHLRQAGDVFDEVHLGPDADFSGFALVPQTGEPAGGAGTSAARPIVSLDRDGTVIRHREGVLGAAEVRPGTPLPAAVLGMEGGARKRLAAALETSAADGFAYLRLHAGEDDERGMMTIVSSVVRDGTPQFDLFPIGLKWNPQDGAAFAEATGLTATESELIGYVVDGRSLRDFAADRGRALGTARNQMKAVFRKLAIGSQAELVSLYAGYVKSLEIRQLHGKLPEASTASHVAKLADGTHMAFERYGKRGGQPVILLHGAIEGPFATPAMERAAADAGLELFVPWMPFYSDEVAAGKPLLTIRRFVDKLPLFMDALGIGQAPMLAASVSGAYGLATLKAFPTRFFGLVLCGFAPPLSRFGGEDKVNPIWRAPLVVGRRAPAAMDLVVRAVVRLGMRGEAYRYFDRLLVDSPVDRETLRRPDVGAVVRKAIHNRPDRAGRALAHAILVQAQDWGDWLEGHDKPVRVIIGAQDAVHAPDQQIRFCRQLGFEPVGPLVDTGGFSLFQQPARIFAKLSAMAAAGD
ncbi:alpha/beta fold hydrolase [Paraurantiacibacter namhicola]|uniref:Alpha/beta hydrolase family protein n=1 Tax=Paraurantiacibacter namhicola TaxID=645517 RepID=A0A1C7DBR8_9SPHN|nr:alpha/beta hydrolase [Paraurantiacibacter namhicola]ANU08723.1 Alpha/beta hydrolase family protein [Paraurantiacibacter namhicola]